MLPGIDFSKWFEPINKAIKQLEKQQKRLEERLAKLEKNFPSNKALKPTSK